MNNVISSIGSLIGMAILGGVLYCAIVLPFKIAKRDRARGYTPDYNHPYYSYQPQSSFTQYHAAQTTQGTVRDPYYRGGTGATTMRLPENNGYQPSCGMMKIDFGAHRRGPGSPRPVSPNPAPFPQYGHGSQVSYNTYSQGNLNHETPIFHPTTNHQNGTRLYQGETYIGTRTNSGAIIYDPNNRAVLGE